MKVLINDYDHLGRGISRVDGKVIFVPKTVKGCSYDVDIVKDKKRYLVGEVKNDEKKYFCPYYNKCGGCQVGHLKEDEELTFKKEKVQNILKKYAEVEVSDILMISTKRYHYRNKVVFHIEKDKMGFYEEKTNKLIDIISCKLLDEVILSVGEKLREFIKDHQRLVKATIKSYDQKVMLILEGGESDVLIKDYFTPFVDSLYYNNKLLSGLEALTVNIFDKEFVVRKDSFFQVNKVGVIAIYSEVIRIVKELKSRILYDLYCGTGTMGILVSPYVFKVKGIEVVPDAIKDAKFNALKNNVSNISFYLGDAFEVFSKFDEVPDTVIVDPPRSGLNSKMVECLLDKEIANIIYVSCDPLTLSRDIKLLSNKYSVSKLLLVDEFPNTYHVECVTLLKRKNL